MSSNIKNSVYQIITRRREDAERRVEQAERLLEDDNQFKSLNFSYATANIALARHEGGVEILPAERVDELRKKKSEAYAKLTEYLQSKKISLEPIYCCSKCNDTGMLNSKNGREYCSCFKLELSKLLMINSNVTDIDRYTLNWLELPHSIPAEQTEALRKKYDALKKIVEMFPNTTQKNIYITGATGTGKTYALKAMARHIIDKGFFVFYVTAFEMNELFRKYHTTFTSDKDEYLDSFLTADLLIIDDLGTETILNNITKEYLYLVLNERLERGKYTFVSSNLSGEEVRERYDDRIFSRLLSESIAGRSIFGGTDLRNANN